MKRVTSQYNKKDENLLTQVFCFPAKLNSRFFSCFESENNCRANNFSFRQIRSLLKILILTTSHPLQQGTKSIKINDRQDFLLTVQLS